jgi:hypothetical protein
MNYCILFLLQIDKLKQILCSISNKWFGLLINCDLEGSVCKAYFNSLDQKECPRDLGKLDTLHAM